MPSHLRSDAEFRARIESFRKHFADHPLARPRIDGIDLRRGPSGSLSGLESDTRVLERAPAPPGGPGPGPGPGAAGGDFGAGNGPSVSIVGPQRIIDDPNRGPDDDGHHGGPYQGHGDRHRYKKHLYWHTTFRSCFGFGYGWWSCFRFYAPGPYAYCRSTFARYWPWGWSGWSGYGSGYGSTYGSPANYASAGTTYVPYYPPPCAYTQSEAWEFLADGQASLAAEAFDCLRGVVPQDGLSEIGFALANAFLGESDLAVRSMRDAVVRDPGALAVVPADERLSRSMIELARLYEYRARSSYGDLDALFMAGSLRYLLGDLGAARYALEAATTLGDADDSTLNLYALVVAAMER